MHDRKLIQALENIKAFTHNTPILSSNLIDKIANCSIKFKCENFQKMGAFKMRGAINALSNLNEKQKRNGVITHSSGNFAQALALSAKLFNIKAYIVMPENAPKVKKNAVKQYGGIIIECKSTQQARENTTLKLQKETNATFIHPYNDLNVIYGQGTACMELLTVDNNFDYIITPVGGGGLLSGTALANKYYNSKAKIIGAEPFEVDDAYNSLKYGKIIENKTINTIADGLRTNLGSLTFPLIKEHVHEIIRVTEQEIIDSMKLIWERMKIIIEPSSAVAIAAVLKNSKKFKNSKIGVIISGGNVDLSNLPF